MHYWLLSVGRSLIATLTMVMALFPICAHEARAGEQQGFITSIIVRDTDGLIYFSLTGTPSGKPACAYYQGWSIPNESSETGKKLFALLLTARALNQEILVYGKNTCNRWGDQEDVAGINLLN